MIKKVAVRKLKTTSNEDFFPMVDYLKKYLRYVKPGKDMPEDEIDAHAYALRCVEEMEKIILKRCTPLEKKHLLAGLFPRCLWGWVVIPPLISMKRPGA